MHRKIAVALIVLLWTVSADARDPYTLSIWVRNNSASVTAYNNNNAGTMTDVNPTWYYLSDPAAGPVRIVPPPGGIVGGLNTTGARVIPTVRNIINGSGDFSPLPTNWILNNQDYHVADIKALLDANPQYAGIELDYERMAADTDDPAVIAWRRDAFSSLVEKIKAAIGPSKILSVCVYRKRDVNGSRDSKNSRVQDWARLTGPNAADQLKVMMYTDISSTSDEIVKNTAYREALTFGQSQVVNQNKLIVALPWYGANVSASPRYESTAPAFYCCASRNNSGELRYNDSTGATWVVMDEQATRQKILIALNEFDVGGFAFWEAGRIVNWPEVWETIRGRIDSAGATVRAVPPGNCTPTPVAVYVDWAYTSYPPGATYGFNWYQWGGSTGNYSWKATGNPSSPGLPTGTFAVRIHGVTGRRVYEAESPMFTIGCN